MEAMQLFSRQTKAISTARRSLLIIESIPGIRYNEIVDVELGTGEVRSGQVIEAGKNTTVVQVWGVSEVDCPQQGALPGRDPQAAVSPDIWAGSRRPVPIDGGPPWSRASTLTSNAFPQTPRACRRLNSSAGHLGIDGSTSVRGPEAAHLRGLWPAA